MSRIDPKSRARYAVYLGDFEQKIKGKKQKTPVISRMTGVAAAELGITETANDQKLKTKNGGERLGSKGDKSISLVLPKKNKARANPTISFPIPSWLGIADMRKIAKKSKRALGFITPQGVKRSL